MGLFRPTALKPGLADLSPELFRQLGVSAVLLDVDNTIASYTSHQPIPGAMEWAKAMKVINEEQYQQILSKYQEELRSRK